MRVEVAVGVGDSVGGEMQGHEAGARGRYPATGIATGTAQDKQRKLTAADPTSSQSKTGTDEGDERGEQETAEHEGQWEWDVGGVLSQKVADGFTDLRSVLGDLKWEKSAGAVDAVASVAAGCDDP